MPYLSFQERSRGRDRFQGTNEKLRGNGSVFETSGSNKWLGHSFEGPVTMPVDLLESVRSLLGECTWGFLFLEGGQFQGYGF